MLDAMRFFKENNLYTGVIHDAARFDLGLRNFRISSRIGRLTGPRILTVGLAFTCLGTRLSESSKPQNDRLRIEMLSRMKPGDMQVIQPRDLGVAHFGDISALVARKHGAVGALVDGYTRDVDVIDRMGFPVYARGSRPEDAYGYWEISEIGVPLVFEGEEGPVTVEPGDLICADGDSTLVIPNGHIDRLLEPVRERFRNEEEARNRLQHEDSLAVYDSQERW